MPAPTAEQIDQEWIDRNRTTFASLTRAAIAHPTRGAATMPARPTVFHSPEEPTREISVLVTFDVGKHMSGDWRSHYYDDCVHLSFTIRRQPFFNQGIQELAFETPTPREVRCMAQAAFPRTTDKLWTEPPARPGDPIRTAAPSPHTYHLRLFLDRKTRQPIVPPGELYNLKPYDDGSSPPEAYH